VLLVKKIVQRYQSGCCLLLSIHSHETIEHCNAASPFQGRTQRGVGVKLLHLSVIFYKNFIIRECIGLDFYKNKESACRRICLLCQQMSFESTDMTSNCDVTKSAHQLQMTTICH